MVWVEPVSLQGDCVALEPLYHRHLDDLVEAVQDGELHKLWYTIVPPPDRVAAEIDRRLALCDAATMVPFAVIDRASGKAVGMTTFMNIDAVNRRLEIGSTWYRRSFQRTALNTECKYLLLTHAFETLDSNCVEFRTHILNRGSRRAIGRLGAKFDGVLRAHMIMPNGTVRDTCVYSIIASEWPTVKAHLSWLKEKPEAERLT